MNRRLFLQNSLLAAAGVFALPLASRVPFGHTAHAAPGDDPKAPVFTGQEVFDRLLKLADENNWRKLPIGERMTAIGLALRGTPYVGSTLELYEDREVCSVNLLGLDCVTFFEIALGFARMLVRGGTTPQALLDEIEMTRYRDGRVTDYTSRLHYTTDWFHDNQAKGVVTVVTQELPGAEPFTKTIDFMSTHPDAYKQLKADPTLVPRIVEIERRLNKRQMTYVPKEKVAAIESRLRSGDIIGVTTTIKGIDCSHTGMCHRDENGALRFLHASTGEKKVYLDTTLSGYLASVSKHTGIMVARPVEG
jgi:hypothetical protein